MEQRHEGLSWKWNECFFYSKSNFYFPVLTFDSNVRCKINMWNQGGKLSFQSVKPQIKQNSSSFAKTEEALNAFKRYCLNVCVNSCLYHKDLLDICFCVFLETFIEYVCIAEATLYVDFELVVQGCTYITLITLLTRER